VIPLREASAFQARRICVFAQLISRPLIFRV
jgi:hypothetical protein